jgi:hypothetical protein
LASALREEEFEMFENKVLRRTLECKEKNVRGCWIKL